MTSLFWLYLEKHVSYSPEPDDDDKSESVIALRRQNKETNASSNIVCLTVAVIFIIWSVWHHTCSRVSQHQVGAKQSATIMKTETGLIISGVSQRNVNNTENAFYLHFIYAKRQKQANIAFLDQS